MTSGPASFARARVWVSGRVQGVAYRAFTQGAARRRGLTGGVRNLDDGRVEVEVEGPRPDVDAFLGILRAGPPRAEVVDLDVRWESPTRERADFVIWY